MNQLASWYSTNEKTLLLLTKSGFTALIVIAGAYFLSKFIRKAVFKGIFHITKHDELVSRLLSNVAGYIVYLIALVMILDIFGVNTAGLVALVGATGIAIGLALKDTLSNVAAGVMLLFLKPFKKADYIEVAGSLGNVIDLGLFTTELETADGLYISLPNSNVWANPIKNYSRNPKRRVEIMVSISHKDSFEEALNLLKDLVQKETKLLKDPEPQYIVHTVADSTINLQLRVWCPTADYWDVYWHLQKTVRATIKEHGFSAPHQQRDIHVHYLPGQAPTEEPKTKV